MRLTLRTLLAYLDNILELDDRELLEKKVQESEFAQNLIKRSRETVNNQELSALDPIGHSIRQDPNAVAEYLDNTMAREQIEEFERQCLDNTPEADTRLAEITACHHILTMVLGDPVQFAASSRERMYRIGESETIDRQTDAGESGQEPIAGVEQTDTHAVAGSASSNQSTTDPDDSFDPADLLPSSKVPDYLRSEDNRNRWLPIIATTLVAAVVTGILLILFEPSSSAIKQSENGAVAKSDSQDVAENPSVSPDQNPALQGSTPPVIPEVSEENNSEKVTTNISEKKIPSDSSESAKPPVENSTPNQPVENSDTSSNDAAKPNARAVPAEGKEVLPESGAPSSATQENPPTNDTLPTNTEEPVEAEQPSAGSQDTDKDTSKPTATDDLPAEAAEGGNQVLGRLVSDDQILLVSSDGFDKLRWLPPQSNLKKGQTLVALPTFRPNLSLLALTVELEGGSILELLDLNEGGIPILKLAYGRMVVRTNFNGGMFHLKINDKRSIALTLKNTETAIGVEVFPETPLGRDPETAERDYTIDVYTLSGSVDWQEEPLQGVVEAGQLQSLGRMPPPEPQSFSVAPEWATKVQMSKLDARAFPAIRDVLQDDRNVKLSFSELVEKRRQVEVKQLALRCCAHIGYFDPLVEALGDESMDRRWEKCATYLQEAAWRHPEYARRVRESMERLRNEKGVDLYRMLWGYTNEGLLNNGEAEQLVEFLSSEDLDLRVLSHWNLKTITGKGYTFQPNKSESKRRKSLKRWQALLNKGNIKYKPN
jgi:hypothetical protein